MVNSTYSFWLLMVEKIRLTIKVLFIKLVVLLLRTSPSTV